MKVFVALGVALIVALSAAAFSCTLYKTAFYKRALPEEIEVSGLVHENSRGSLLSRKACGGALFDLTEEARAAIEKEGLSFFKAALQGRGYKEGRKRHYYSYAPWQETPVPSGWIGDGKWAAGLHCLGLPRALSRNVADAAKQPGSYYTTKDEAELLVIPSLGVVVFTFFG